jgi:NTP pyrophosphatase (non-canonical NTP hydrolase)
MKFDEYQRRASKTNFIKASLDDAKMVVLLGLSGEVGELLQEYKKSLRTGGQRAVQPERVEEELGDILWYLSECARQHHIDLDVLAKRSLEKGRRIAGATPSNEYRLFDDEEPPRHQIPRQFTLEFAAPKDPVRKGKRLHGPAMAMFLDGRQIGATLTDNNEYDDGYRVHDIFHLAYAAHLGWSPVLRQLLGCKRPHHGRDDVQDGGRALAIEEGISAMVYAYKTQRGERAILPEVDSQILRTIATMCRHLEVSRRTPGDWARAIESGFHVWSELRHHGAGRVSVNLLERSIVYEELEPTVERRRRR